jgi:hypothetical protein
MNETIFLHPKGATSSVMRLGRVLILECNDILTRLLRCIELVSKSNTTEREALRSGEAVRSACRASRSELLQCVLGSKKNKPRSKPEHGAGITR